MNNYPYIIAGLPDLVLSADNASFDYASLREHIYDACGKEGQRLIDWVEFGLDEKHLSHHFYRAAAAHKNLFISTFFTFDKIVREAKVAFIEHKPFETEFDEAAKIQTIFKTPNIYERELHLDKLTWEKINSIIAGEVLSINIILAFLTKAKIVNRWSKLDRKKGAELCAQLVQEVRGTFKGVEYN